MKRALQKAAVLLFWLSVWEIAALLTGTELILPGIGTTLQATAALLVTPGFYTAFLGTIFRVFAGVLISVLLGLVFGFLAAFSKPVALLIEPLVSFIRNLPVVSISILLNLWLASQIVPLAVAFFICFPVTYTNILSGIHQTDPLLVEMSGLYRVSFSKQLRDLYLPAVLPDLGASLISSLGMGWKATVTAETLASLQESVGMNLQNAKLYLLTPELFAWTFMLVIISMGIEWGLKRLIRRFLN